MYLNIYIYIYWYILCICTWDDDIFRLEWVETTVWTKQNATETPSSTILLYIYIQIYIYIYLSLRSNIDVLQICSLVNRIDDGTYSLPSVWVGWNLAITWYVIGAKKLRCASQIKHDKTMVNPGIVTMGIVTQENSLSIPISMGWLSRSHKTGVYMGIVTLLIYHISIYIYPGIR